MAPRKRERIRRAPVDPLSEKPRIDTPPRPRGYSRKFTPRSAHPGRYLLDQIPITMWHRAQRRARRESISIRFLLLHCLRRFARGEAFL